MIIPTDISLPLISCSIITSSSSLNAYSIEFFNLSIFFTLDIPKLDPPLFGFTKTGIPVIFKISLIFILVFLVNKTDFGVKILCFIKKFLHSLLLNVSAV